MDEAHLMFLLSIIKPKQDILKSMHRSLSHKNNSGSHI